MFSLLRFMALAVTAGFLANTGDQVGLDAWDPRPPRPPPDICSRLASSANALSVADYLRVSNNQCSAGPIQCVECLVPPATPCVKLFVNPTKTSLALTSPTVPVLLGLSVVQLMVFTSVLIGLLAGSSVVSQTSPLASFATSYTKGVISFYWWLAIRARTFVASLLKLITPAARSFWNSFPIVVLRWLVRLAFTVVKWLLYFVLAVLFVAYGIPALFRVAEVIVYILLGPHVLVIYAILAFCMITFGTIYLAVRVLYVLLALALTSLWRAVPVALSMAQALTLQSFATLGEVGRRVATETGTVLYPILADSTAVLSTHIYATFRVIAHHVCSLTSFTIHIYASTTSLAFCLLTQAHLLRNNGPNEFVPLPTIPTVLTPTGIFLAFIVGNLEDAWGPIQPHASLLANTVSHTMCHWLVPLLRAGQIHLVYTASQWKVRIMAWIASLLVIYRYLRTSVFVLHLLVVLSRVCSQLTRVLGHYLSRPYQSRVLPIYRRTYDTVTRWTRNSWHGVISFAPLHPPNIYSPAVLTAKDPFFDDIPKPLPLEIPSITATVEPSPNPSSQCLDVISQPHIRFGNGPVLHDLHLPWSQVKEYRVLTSEIDISNHNFDFRILGTSVYIANTAPKKALALKVIRKNSSDADLRYYATLAEAEISSDVKTLSIFPKFHGLYENDVLYGLLYDAYMEGSLRHRLDLEVTLDLEEAISLSADILLGLHHLHHLGIVHRDINPDNILLHKGRPIITDFGASYFFGEEDDPAWVSMKRQAGYDFPLLYATPDNPHTLNSPAGDQEYMAPEVGNPDATYSYGVDFFSLFMMTYEMLSGQRPYIDHIHKVVFLSPRLLYLYDESVDALLRKALSYHAEERPKLSTIIVDSFFSDIDWEARRLSMVRNPLST